VGAGTIYTLGLIDTVIGRVSHLPTSGTGEGSLTCSATVPIFLAFEATQRVRYVY